MHLAINEVFRRAFGFIGTALGRKAAPSQISEVKQYTLKEVAHLKPEAAKLLLLGEATAGNQSARDLLQFFFPDARDARPGTCP